jgi:hypothetical protein
MADLQRTVEARLKVTKEGDAEAFSEVAADVDALRGAAAETADVLPDITSALQDVAAAQEETAKATEGNVKQIRSLHDLAKSAGGEMGALATKVLAVGGALQVASKSLDEAIDGLNKLDKAAGGAGDSYTRLAGIIPFPKKAFEELRDAIVDVRGHIEKHTGVVEEQIAAYEKARAAYLTAVAGLGEVEEAQKKVAAATEEATKAQEKSIEEWQAIGDKAAAESAKREQEALELTKKSALEAADLVKRITDQADTANTAGLDKMTAALKEVTAAAREASAALDDTLNLNPIAGDPMQSTRERNTMMRERGGRAHVGGEQEGDDLGDNPQ